MNYSKAWREKQKAKGLCIYCMEPAIATLTSKVGVFCVRHRKMNSKGEPKAVKLLIDLDAFVHLPIAELSYVAGIVDGEGYVGFHRGSSRHFMMPIITVGMTDREPVEYCAALFGSNVTEHKTQNGVVCYSWKCGSSRASALAKAILPYLRIPRKQQAAAFCVRMRSFLGVSRWRVAPNQEAIAQRTVLDTEIKEWHQNNRSTRARALDTYYTEMQ